jgi:hypothetical protein
MTRSRCQLGVDRPMKGCAAPFVSPARGPPRVPTNASTAAGRDQRPGNVFGTAGFNPHEANLLQSQRSSDRSGHRAGSCGGVFRRGCPSFHLSALICLRLAALVRGNSVEFALSQGSPPVRFGLARRDAKNDSSGGREAARSRERRSPGTVAGRFSQPSGARRHSQPCGKPRANGFVPYQFA